MCFRVLLGGGVGFDDVLGDLDDLSRFDVPDELSADGIDGSAFRHNHISSLDGTDAERSESIGIAECEQPVVDQDAERECTVDLAHHGSDGSDDVIGGVQVLGKDLRDDLGVGVGHEGPSGILVLRSELAAVGEVAVVCDGDGAFCEINGEGLCVYDSLRPCGRITYVADTDVPSETAHGVLVESFGDQTVTFDGLHNSICIDGYSRGFLPAVLNDIKGPVQVEDYVCICHSAHDAATVLRSVHADSLLLVGFRPVVGSQLCGLSVSAGSTDSLPCVVCALAAAAAGDVGLKLVVPSLCGCTCSHFSTLLMVICI